MTNPKVTIITPIFNLYKNSRVKSFEKCLVSVRTQNYSNIEHLVIDGGSNDGTVNLLKKYQKRGWIKHISEKDTGIYDAMNKGIKLSKGKYIAFLNSDDFYHNKSGVKLSVEALESTRSDFSYSPAIIKFEDGSLFKDHPQANPKISNVFFTMPFSHQTMFTKKEIFIREGLFDTKYKSAADYDFVIRVCLKKYKSIFVNKSFVTYFFIGISSTNQELSQKEVSQIYLKHYQKYYPKFNLSMAKAMCQSFYTHKYYDTFPKQLAEKLKNHQPYFNYQDYQSQIKTISIITITYNNPDIQRTLDSILTQVYDPKKIEHIIVDNLSTDNTENIVNRYISQTPYKVKYIREKDNGIFDAMNKGIKHSTEKYLLFLNAGDHFFDNNAIANLLDNSDNLDIVYGNIQVVMEEGQTTYYNPPDVLNFKYFLNYALPHQASIIKKELFNKIGYYDDALKVISDWKFFILAICKYKCSYKHINSKISYYYTGGNSSLPKNLIRTKQEKSDVYNKYFSEINQKTIKGKYHSKFTTPILFIIFNRPDTTQKVFNVIKKIRPKYLYVAADGPRKDKIGENKKCQQTRNIINQINWNCQLKTLFRNTNFGCGHAVSKAVTWYFDQIKEGIVLEDDCFPDESFFNFCQKLLKKYRNNKKVMHISGDQFVDNYQSLYSYYFSKFMHCWGWASWSDRWNLYDYNPDLISETIVNKITSNKTLQNYWQTIIKMLKNREIDTWDYQWTFTIIKNDGLCINPSKNLISNIGFGSDSTHTPDKKNTLANLPIYSIKHIKHPKKIALDHNAVDYLLKNHYLNNIDKNYLCTNYIKEKIKHFSKKIYEIIR